MECPAHGCAFYSRCPHVRMRTAEKCGRFQSRRRKNYLRLEDCSDTGVYELIARSAGVGIFYAEAGCFRLARYINGERVVFEEDHWDKGGPFGSAIPVRKIEQAPPFANDSQMLDYLESVELRLRENECYGKNVKV